MRSRSHTTPAMLFVIGASGAGKTAVVTALAARGLAGVRCHHFDSVGVPAREAMERAHGGPEAWQAAATLRSVERLAANDDGAEVAVLEGQTRPSFLREALAPAGVRRVSIVLLDCTARVRAARLRGPRAQPELASPEMESWAAYLRGQADAFGLAVVDTSRLDVEAVANALAREIEQLRRR